MDILAQRGEDIFMVEDGGKFFIVNTGLGERVQVTHPQVLYKAGYCEDPHPTPELLEAIRYTMKNKEPLFTPEE